MPSKRPFEDVLGLRVAIEHKGQGGEIRIRYKTLEQLDGLCRRLNHCDAERSFRFDSDLPRNAGKGSAR